MRYINLALTFMYDNVLSILTMVLLIAAGVFLTVRLGFFQFRKFGYVSKHTIGSLFDKKLHTKEKG